MDKPCRYCKSALPELYGELFEPECDGACEKYKQYSDGVSKGLNEILASLEGILKNHQKEIEDLEEKEK